MRDARIAWYGSPLGRGLLIGTVAAGLSACTGMVPTDDSTAIFKNLTQKISPGAPNAVPGTSLNPALPGLPSGSVPAGVLQNARPQSSVNQLIAKRTVTGTDLLEELKELKLAAGDRKSRLALAGAIGNASSTVMGSRNNLLLNVQGKLVDAVVDTMKDQVAGYSFTALTDFLNTLTGDTDALGKETIELPRSLPRMTLPQQQSVLTMAALVVAARITHKDLDAAQSDFKNIQADFEKLLDRRQKTAALMADVLDRRRKAMAARQEAEVRHMEADLQQWLSPEDLKFIDSFGEDRPLRDFSNDLGMQNLALKFLRHSDPQAYADFRSETDGVVGRSRAYLRTMAGVAAFGGFSALFTQDVVNTTRDKDMGETLAVLPFAWQFAKEAGPLVRLSVQTLYTGIVIEPAQASLNYRLVRGTQVSELQHAKNVFETLSGANEGRYFSDALFRNGTPGFIYRVYLCDPTEAGHLIDKAVPTKNRRQFAENYLHAEDADGFLFANALSGDPADKSVVRLVEPLLSRDQRVRAEAVPLGEIQTLTTSNYPTWVDSQFMRVVLSNSEGSYAQMQLGNTLVRLIPSMATVYAYETYADSCRRAAAAGAGSATPDAKTKAMHKKARPKANSPGSN